MLDPSRVAAQIVSGIGFIGGGLIFVRRDAVRGLTTAAIVWLTAAIGMACGAGLPILALVVTAAHFVVVFAFPAIVVRLPRSRWAPSALQISYEDGRGVLRDILVVCTQQGFSVSRLRVARDGSRDADGDRVLADSDLENGTTLDTADEGRRRVVVVALEVQGSRSVARLGEKLSDLQGVITVAAGDANVVSE